MKSLKQLGQVFVAGIFMLAVAAALGFVAVVITWACWFGGQLAFQLLPW